jgi:hypothetical protein
MTDGRHRVVAGTYERASCDVRATGGVGVMVNGNVLCVVGDRTRTGRGSCQFETWFEQLRNMTVASGHIVLNTSFMWKSGTDFARV